MTAAQFLDLVRRSQLLDEQKVREFLDFAGDGERLATALVEAELLTQWQAVKLLAGKFKGFRLGNYILLSHRGKQGMGQEYIAIHDRLKRKVVLSVLPASRVEDSTQLYRFEREMGPAKLEHDGKTHFVVRPLDEDQ